MNRFTTVESKEIHNIFQNLFDGEHEWVYQKSIPGEVTIHVTKKAENDIDITDITMVNRFDARPYPPAKRRNLVFEAFDDLKPGEAFVFVNDKDPKWKWVKTDLLPVGVAKK